VCRHSTAPQWPRWWMLWGCSAMTSLMPRFSLTCVCACLQACVIVLTASPQSMCWRAQAGGHTYSPSVYPSCEICACTCADCGRGCYPCQRRARRCCGGQAQVLHLPGRVRAACARVCRHRIAGMQVCVDAHTPALAHTHTHTNTQTHTHKHTRACAHAHT